ncbi:MAG: serine hydrolase [Phaeodactylibacter sp.]|nr:serine hydrolase [Phaeodactylibacter sp.]MCB9273624.1 serine hydrolase [Lewinellaceae bacterium]
MKRIPFFQTFLFLLIAHFAIAQAAAPLPAFVTDSLDSYVKLALERWQIPGVAVGIVKDGQLVVAKGYGLRELGQADKVDENTLFMIASNTKAFTATALAMLEQDSLCSLDDRVKRWLPEFRMKDPWVTDNAILTDLLCHRMGLETFQGDFMYFDSGLTSAQVVEKFGKITPLYDFRTRWGYCNAAFLLAGECIQRISGDSWAATLRKRIFEPLEMNRTLALATEINGATNRASAHTIYDGKLMAIPYGELDAIAPAGSISSSIEDMSHWLIAQLGGGMYKGKEVIPAAAISRTRQPQSIMGRRGHPFNTSHYGLYAMGWQLQDYEGKEIISHTGGIDGFVTSVTLLPEEKLGVVVLTNTDQNYFYEALKWEIVDAFLGLPYRDYSKAYFGYYQRNTENEAQAIQALRDSVATGHEPSLPVKAYAGRYTNEIYGHITLKPEGNGLTVTFEHHPKLSARLEPMGGNRFLCTYSNPLYGVKAWPFETEAGKVKRLTLTVNDFIEFTPYVFIKD